LLVAVVAVAVEVSERAVVPAQQVPVVAVPVE